MKITFFKTLSSVIFGASLAVLYLNGFSLLAVFLAGASFLAWAAAIAKQYKFI